MKPIYVLICCSLLFCLFSSAVYADDWTVVTGADAFEKGYLLVVGESASNQSRYKAKRSATVIAQRNMLEVIQGLELMGGATVKDGELLDDTIKTSISGVLRGAQVVGEEYIKDEGYARVALRVNLYGENSLYQTLSSVLEDPPVVLVPSMPVYQAPTESVRVVDAAQEATLSLSQVSIPDSTPTSLVKPASSDSATPVSAQKSTLGPVPPQNSVPLEAPVSALKVVKDVEYDGLILWAKGSGLRPALGNRIVTDKMDMVFGPSVVDKKYSGSRGAGTIARTDEKAKKFLEHMGSKNPLTVRSESHIKGTDAVISEEDAEKIMKENSKTNMLSKAKVVFVL
ncbi:MAG: hypothetical protein ACNI27_13085 [Desulfovibrio sp.]